MNSRSPVSGATRALGWALCAALALPPRFAYAAVEEPSAPSSAPVGAGKTVALLRFGGVEPAADLRTEIQAALEEAGFSIKSVALDIDAAAAKVKCKKGDLGPECLARLGEWLDKNPKTKADFVGYGKVEDVGGRRVATIVLYDVAKKVEVDRLTATLSPGDLIVPIVVPRATATALSHHLSPPAPASAVEQKVLAELDEPAKTPEEIAAENKQLDEAREKASNIDAGDLLAGGVKVDLRADFKDFCRTGPRKKRKTREEPKDLRPKCSMGPVWGYWQPRAWVALGLTLGAAATAVGLYGVALAHHATYKDHKSALDDFQAAADREAGRDVDPKTDPDHRCVADGRCYEDLAAEVSVAGTKMQRLAITGDAVLGAAVFLAGVLAIIVYQDRNDARKFFEEEKSLRAISRVRVSPMVGPRFQGASFGFRF